MNILAVITKIVILGVTAPTTIDVSTLTNIVWTIFNWGVALSVPTGAVYMMYSFYSLMSSHTNVQKREHAKESLKWTAISLVGIILSWAIATMIASAITTPTKPPQSASYHHTITASVVNIRKDIPDEQANRAIDFYEFDQSLL